MGDPVSLSGRSLPSTGFFFLFHQVHRRTHFEFDKYPTPSSPEFWSCGRCWRWRRRLVQLGYLDLAGHNWHGECGGIVGEWPAVYSESTREVCQWRCHHPTVIALHGIPASVTNQSAGCGIRAKEREKHYCQRQDPPTSFHANLRSRSL